MGWADAKNAPKDGRQIIAVFKTLPYPAAAMWNSVDNNWVVATCSLDMYNGKWVDCSFENERYGNDELKVWMDMPGANP